jgi:NAD(P)-dependent dehydrogenase (short-subunit alcohol dehydrogenase family)
VIVATGALEISGATPEKSLRGVEASALAAQFALNSIGPMLVLKHALRLLPRDAHARFAVLSARVGSIGDNRLGGWYSYRAAKAALNQLVHTAAIEIVRTHPQAVITCLHPGTVATPFTAKYLGTHPAVPPDEAAQNLLGVLDSLTPAQTGGFFDWQGKVVPW